MAGWTTSDIPDQRGRTAIVTGGNSGIGAVAVRELARAGARVVLACRDRAKGEAAARSLAGEVEVRELDLASLTSVRAFAADVAEPVDVLVNNAGVMATPHRTTADGFELQLGTNHLGHFALTGLLLERIRDRVVTVSSGAHRFGRIRFDDLQSERRYGAWTAYGQSKLANLLFTFELARRLDAAGEAVRAVACHPGYAATNLQSVGPRMAGSRIGERVMELGNALLAQDADGGALPTLYAATAPDLAGGSYVGPGGLFELRGAPQLVRPRPHARDPETARRLWARSAELTGVRYAFADASPT